MRVRAAAGLQRASRSAGEIIGRERNPSRDPASHADITLRELMFRVIFGTEEETWRLDELTMENVSVGWFAG